MGGAALFALFLTTPPPSILRDVPRGRRTERVRESCRVMHDVAIILMKVHKQWDVERCRGHCFTRARGARAFHPRHRAAHLLRTDGLFAGNPRIFVPVPEPTTGVPTGNARRLPACACRAAPDVSLLLVLVLEARPVKNFFAMLAVGGSAERAERNVRLDVGDEEPARTSDARVSSGRRGARVSRSARYG